MGARPKKRRIACLLISECKEKEPCPVRDIANAGFALIQRDAHIDASATSGPGLPSPGPFA